MRRFSSRWRAISDQRGLTLVEMLVVLAILALVVGLVGPRVVDYLGRAKSTTARLQIENLAAGLDLFRLDLGRYPTQQEGLAALVQRPAGAAAWKGPYIKGDGLPNDPWGRPYSYRLPGRDGRPFDLLSLGADGAPGGTGENQDITN
ncbi:MAG: type II secretion system protein GspG [Alphaproteobacteria bacterium]|nr:type II secretion system protein GspG [Alphaproteobacteria bacterium]